MVKLKLCESCWEALADLPDTVLAACMTHIRGLTESPFVPGFRFVTGPDDGSWAVFFDGYVLCWEVELPESAHSLRSDELLKEALSGNVDLVLKITAVARSERTSTGHA